MALRLKTTPALNTWIVDPLYQISASQLYKTGLAVTKVFFILLNYDN